MKVTSIIYLHIVAVATLILCAGCSDSFLKEKMDYSKVGSELWENYEGCLARINNIYTVVLPIYSGDDNLARYPSSGNADIFSMATEEYSGLRKNNDPSFIDPGLVMDYTNIPDYFFYSRKTSEGPYGHIRNCNDAIEGISASTGITEKEREELLGQAYFFRAWLYYRLVKVYGGVPIVIEVQDPIASSEAMEVSRSTTKDCIEFICDDLEKAAEYLPYSWDASNTGRVTSGTALALMGRVRLLYASPLFNRTDDIARWELAYQANKRAKEALIAGGFELAYMNDDDMKLNAKGWAKMFSDYNSPEAVFVTLYNNRENPKDGTSPYKNNGWENGIRPTNAVGGGGKTPSAMLVDMFPMSDGSKSSYCSSLNTYSKLQASEISYNSELPFVNRDPRFYRTFAFPGVKWQFDADLSNRKDFKEETYPYDNGNKYELWNYAWYSEAEDRDADNFSGYGADGLSAYYKGFYIRKKTDDLQLNSSPLYKFTKTEAFKLSAAPYMEIRFAEVLLNLAESACGAGKNEEAIKELIDIRKRVGYTESNNYYGLGDLKGSSDRAKLFSAILYERQIELAYEGKRFDDMRRWLLWDGGDRFSEINGAPGSWTLTGFEGNTCKYLGISPLNDKRRDNLEFRVNNNINDGLGGTNVNGDPLKDVKRPQALDLNEELSDQMDDLVEFYETNLVRKTRRGDEMGKVVTFLPEYYFIGLKSSAQINNPTLEQTIGWGAYATGGSMGTFDPLAE